MKNTDIILVHPQHPGNIGFTARAMKTMGFKNLVVVASKPFNKKAAKVTATDAKDVVDSCRIVSDMSDILTDYHFLVAFTARTRRFRNTASLPGLPGKIAELPGNVKTGLVFGRESSGLTNEEVGLCHCAVTIPTARAFHSLNLSHAVQVVCYELNRAGKILSGASAAKSRNTATAMEREAIFEKLTQVSLQSGMKKQDAQKVEKIFRLIFEDRPLKKQEAGAFHRFLDQVLHGKKQEA